MFNGKIILRLKGFWKDCVITSKRLDENYCQIQGWKRFVKIRLMHQTFFWGAQYHGVAIL